MSPAPEYLDIPITGPSGRVITRFRRDKDGWRQVGFIVEQAPSHLPAAAVSILSDGRYLCDAGPFDMPDPYAAAAGAAGARDMLPVGMGDVLPHSLPLLDPDMEAKNPASH